MELQYSTYGSYDDSGETQYHPDADLQSTATEAGEQHLKERCEAIIKQAGLHTMKVMAGGKTIREETFDFDNDIGYSVYPGDCYDGASMSVTLYPGSEDQSQIEWFELIRDTVAKQMNEQNDEEGNDATWLAMAESLYEHSHTVEESDPASIRALEDHELIYGSDGCIVKEEDATPEDIAHHRSFTMTEDERKIYEFVKEKKAVNNNA
jgi:hypothetical protein